MPDERENMAISMRVIQWMDLIRRFPDRTEIFITDIPGK